MINSICIVGGGTSGMVTALMLRKAWPTLKITVIESSQIGIVGVGEGSTEHWKKFIDQVGISVFDLIRETGATYKIGIKFTNWHGDGTHYFHSLVEDYCNHSPDCGLPYMWYKMLGENWDPLKTHSVSGQTGRHFEPLHTNLSQYHFDTHKLNTFLHKTCSERSIDIIDAIVEDVILDNEGYVSELKFDNGLTFKDEFFVDCSGFKRIIISKLGAVWVDKSAELPMNAAIAFPTGYQEHIPSWTEATALSSGWAWRIPTQERFGNGYVFCDEFINETQAYDEVQQHYTKNLGIKEPLQIGKKFKFAAGHVDQFWIKNCVAVGLSGVFVEPLEASSIGTTIQQSFILSPSLGFFTRGESLTAKKYNEVMQGVCDNIVDFIQLHYITQRDDTEFWKWIKHNLKLTDFNREYLPYFRKNMTNVFYFNDHFTLFKHLNFIQVMHGLRLFYPEKMKEVYTNHLSRYEGDINKILNLNGNMEVIKDSFSHREALNILKERYDEIKYGF
jgi:tryptophan halogenase